MSVINIFIAISIVVVVSLFLSFLYQTKQINNTRFYDYDIDPSESSANSTYKLICPNGYTYNKTNKHNKDICVSDNDSSQIKFKTLREKDENGEWAEFNYPDFETKEGMGRLNDRCKWLDKNSSIKWDAIQPYCEYLDAN